MNTSKKKLISIVGARPQFVKMSAFQRAAGKDNTLEHFIVHTGQHYDKNMSDIFFEEMEIPKPDINLGIGGGSHGENTGRMIERLEKVFLEEQPNWVIVFGDTDSTLAAALAAAKCHIPVAHVEAGLRSFNKKMPEEINRILTDHCSDLLFTPSNTAVKNLKNEGISEDLIIKTGDIMYDVTKYFQSKLSRDKFGLKQWGLTPKEYTLATIHRAENTSSKEQLRKTLECLAQVPGKIVLPLHPRTRNALKKFQLQLPFNVHLIDPIGYRNMLCLEKHARLIVTDSGGVQKEAYFQQVPCITLREETEWLELVEAGVNFVVGTNSHKMQEAVHQIQISSFDFSNELYGNGNSADTMLAALK